jgi:hypothetical protein
MSLEEQIEMIGMAELANCILVTNDIREAMMVLPTDYNECLSHDPKTSAILSGIRKYYPDLKHSDFGINGIVISKKSYSDKEIHGDESVGKVLGYPCSRDYKFILANRDNMEITTIEVNLYFKKKYLRIPIPIQIFSYVCKDASTYPLMKNFSKIAHDVLTNHPLIGFIIDRVDADVIVNIPPKIVLDKLLSKDPLTEEFIDEVKNIIYNIGFSDAFQEYKFQYHNPAHIGIISTIITYYINNPLAPLQQLSVEKDIYKIFCKWEDDLTSILNLLRI